VKTYRYDRERGEVYLVADSFWGWQHEPESGDYSHPLLGCVPYRTTDFSFTPSLSFYHDPNSWRSRL